VKTESLCNYELPSSWAATERGCDLGPVWLLTWKNCLGQAAISGIGFWRPDGRMWLPGQAGLSSLAIFH